MPMAADVKPLKVPERHLPAFQALFRMQQDDFAHLLSVLDAADPTNTPNSLAESIHRETELSVSGARALLDAVLELVTLGQRSLSSSGHMAARVAASSQFTDGDDKRVEFRERTKQLLGSDLIRLHSKVSSIGSEYERVFVNSRILTDLRPIFNDEVSENPEPEAALLSHTLSLHFIGSDRRHDNFYVVLDDSDLRVLYQMINRALQKASSLRLKLKESGLIHMHTEE